MVYPCAEHPRGPCSCSLPSLEGQKSIVWEAHKNIADSRQECPYQRKKLMDNSYIHDMKPFLFNSSNSAFVHTCGIQRSSTLFIYQTSIVLHQSEMNRNINNIICNVEIPCKPVGIIPTRNCNLHDVQTTNPSDVDDHL